MCTVLFNKYIILTFVGRDSSVGIATGYGLGGPEIESRWQARFSTPVQTGPWAYPASCTMGTGSFLRVKSGRGVTLTPHPLLVPWSRKGRAIPLLSLWAVRPVQSLSACTRVHFTFTLYSKTCLKRNAIVPVFFSVFTGFRFTKGCVLIKQSTKNMIA